jgi:ribosomal protein L12E/L44/L45/RPP1/RPP2
MGQLVCNEVETTVMRLSLYETEPIDFAFACASAAVEGEEEEEEEEDEEEKKKEEEEEDKKEKAGANCFYIIANY